MLIVEVEIIIKLNENIYIRLVLCKSFDCRLQTPNWSKHIIYMKKRSDSEAILDWNPIQSIARIYLLYFPITHRPEMEMHKFPRH